MNGSLGPKGFQVNFEYKSTINIAAGVTNEANIRVWNDYTAEKNNEYWWGSSSYRKPMVFKAGAPTVMNGFVHDTNCDYRITFEANSDVTFNGGFKARDAANFTVGAGARVRFNAPLLSRNQFKPAFDPTGVIELNARANCLGCSNPWDRSFDKGTLKLLVPYALEDTTVSREFEYKGGIYATSAIGYFELCGTAVLDFCGNDQSLCCLAARGGIVTSESRVVDATTLTESSVSRLNFAENIVVVAAVGAEQAIVNAITIVLSSFRKNIANAAASGMISSLNTLARYASLSENAFLKFACER